MRTWGYFHRYIVYTLNFSIELSHILSICNVSRVSYVSCRYRLYRHRILWIVWIVWIVTVSRIDGIRFFPLDKYTYSLIHCPYRISGVQIIEKMTFYGTIETQKGTKIHFPLYLVGVSLGYGKIFLRTNSE
jgi:hypothetical protein